MNSTIVAGINDNVKEDDILIHLGDWSFGGIENIWNLKQRLNVKRIHLVLGNHDTHIERNKVLPNATWKPTMDTLINFVARDIFDSVNNYLELNIDKKDIILSHYPIVSWNKAYRGSWMLHGHTHNTLFKKGPHVNWYQSSKIIDVGMDTAYVLYGEYRPFSFKEIKTIMDKRKFISVDQHDKDTNG